MFDGRGDPFFDHFSAENGHLIPRVLYMCPRPDNGKACASELVWHNTHNARFM